MESEFNSTQQQKEDTVREYATELEDGSLKVPPAPQRVKEVPVVGDKVFEIWVAANENLSGVLARFEEPIKQAARWLLKTATGAGL